MKEKGIGVGIWNRRQGGRSHKHKDISGGGMQCTPGTGGAVSLVQGGFGEEKDWAILGRDIIVSK